MSPDLCATTYETMIFSQKLIIICKCHMCPFDTRCCRYIGLCRIYLNSLFSIIFHSWFHQFGCGSIKFLHMIESHCVAKRMVRVCHCWHKKPLSGINCCYFTSIMCVRVCTELLKCVSHFWLWHIFLKSSHLQCEHGGTRCHQSTHSAIIMVLSTSLKSRARINVRVAP